MSKIKRSQFSILYERFLDEDPLIQALLGPRQIGKTTLAEQLAQDIPIPSLFISADGVAPKDPSWCEVQWRQAQLKFKNKPGLLIIDEIHQVSQWSSVIKKLWDEQKRTKESQIRLLLLGSSRVLISSGLKESLAGRFEIIFMGHWSFKDIKKLYPHMSLEDYILYGGYPGAYQFHGQEERFCSYIKNSIIEPAVTKDILLQNMVSKIALMKNTFELACQNSGKILSYNKILGQLQDAGNTTTLANYIHLMDQVGLLCGLQKYSQRKVIKRSSSPKFQIFNNALLVAESSYSFNQWRNQPERWGQLVESAVGTHLVNLSLERSFKTFYWRENNIEVDFVFQKENTLWAIEVKSSKIRNQVNGLFEFQKRYPESKILLLSQKDHSLQDFFENF